MKSAAAIRFLLMSALLLTLSFRAGAQTFDIRFTNPQCKTYGDKPKNAFCTREDLPRNQGNPEGPYRKVIDLIRDRANKKLTLATMTFSHRDVAAELCKAVRRGVEVTVLMDSGAEPAAGEQVAACGGKLFKVGVAEAEGERRGDLHHNKFILAESNDESTLVFATANFSNPGLTINHETWSFVTDSNDSALIRNHHCLIASLKSYRDDLRAFRRDLSQCRVNYARDSKIETLFVPADSSRLIQLIEAEMKKSPRILMTSNRYSFARITKAFGGARAADRRAIFDDDLYWGGVKPTADYEREAVDARAVSGLERAGVNVRFTQTSFGAAQKMHNKFIVFESMVLVGAGNYTGGGLLANFENFYVIREPATVEKFKRQFEYLWGVSTGRRQMPAEYRDPGVRP